MAQVAAGDTAAFEQLFTRHAPRLGAVLRRGGLDREEAQDLLQQTFLIVWRSRLDFDPARPFRPWITTIALNLKRDLLRRRRRSPVEPSGGETGDRDTRGASAIDQASRPPRQERLVQARELREAVARLPESRRAVVELHWLAGLSMAEVGAALGTSTGAVKVRAHKAYAQLRAMLRGGGR
jgi:RNA polymerase sigma-70 factor (ECF subfamily)